MLDKKEIQKLLYSIVQNANWVMESWRAWSDELYFVWLIKQDVTKIYTLLNK